MSSDDKIVYMFYLTGPYVNDCLEEFIIEDEDRIVTLNVHGKDTEAVLYAYTDDKKIAEKFASERNSKRFILVRRTVGRLEAEYYEPSMKQSGYSTFKSRNTRASLRNATLAGRPTATSNTTDIYDSYPMLITGFEAEYLNMELESANEMLFDLDDFCNSFKLIYVCLKDSYKRHLDTIGYRACLQISQELHEPDKIMESELSIIFDEVHSLFEYFSELFDFSGKEIEL